MSRRTRGRESELAMAAYLKENGFEYATAVSPGASGKDLIFTPPFAFELKSRTGFSPQAWVRQAVKNAAPDETPMVVLRCNGQGIQSISDWIAIMRFGDALRLGR